MQETHAFSAETGKLLKLVIHSLYTNKDIFLRELISNASDACEKRRYEALTQTGLGTEMRITLAVDKVARTLSIHDNGIGMTREELARNLGTIARSGTEEFLANAKKEAALIGQFGVGFYSAFMVASRVRVVSRRAGQGEAFAWESDGEGEFTLSSAEGAEEGTTVTLYLREGEDDYLDAHRLRHIVQSYSDHVAFPIMLEGETVNKGTALWARPKAEITPAQYQEFYHHVAHQPEAPWLTFHHKAEGALEYTALLYVPGAKPFDLYNPERKRRVKLYVKRVFITDEGAELVPHYLRFLRGVVDSEDVPLNVSRETLQANPVVARIREGLTKKVLGELKKRMQDKADYQTFWANFGAALKEGLCEANAPRELILEACLFDTSDASGQTSLDDYVARMQPGQEGIYYLAADSREAALASPQIEALRAKGVEVLLLHDHVDDFWLSVVDDYKGQKFLSAMRAGADTVEKKEDASTDEKILWFKKVLGDAVRDVQPTSKLVDSPVCLSVPEGAMDMRLERFLIEQKQLPGPAPKILEVNLSHPLVAGLDLGSAEAEDRAHLLLDQARLTAGEPLPDAAGFVKRMNRVMGG